MRVPPNSGDLASLTSQLKTLILYLGKVLHVWVIQRQKTVLPSFYYLTQPQKCIYMAKCFPAWARPHAAGGAEKLSNHMNWNFCWWNLGLRWRGFPMIFQVHTDPLSFSLALFENELKNYSEGEWLNQRNCFS